MEGGLTSLLLPRRFHQPRHMPLQHLYIRPQARLLPIDLIHSCLGQVRFPVFPFVAIKGGGRGSGETFSGRSSVELVQETADGRDGGGIEGVDFGGVDRDADSV
jgi:hypothetical protein